MSSEGTWLSVPESGHRLAARLGTPTDGGGTGVVIVPPAGYEYSASYRMLWALSEGYRRNGCLVLTVDPFGTGDSEGNASIVDSLDGWREAYAAGALTLRGCGAVRIVVLGTRLSATVALTEARALDADAVVAVAPVTAGARYVQELHLMARHAPGRIGGLSVGGYRFSAALLSEIERLDVSTVHMDDVPALVVEDLSGTSRSNRRRLEEMEGAVETRREAVDDYLSGPAEEADVDPAALERIVAWTVSHAPPGSPGASPCRPVSQALLLDQDREVVERFVSVGHDRLTGVVTSLPQSRPDALVVFLSSGSDPHTGPGRAWVDFARALATRERAVLRVDFRGWGDSPDGPDGPGRPYDEHAEADLAGLVAALRVDGWRTITLAGLCAGAWVALRAARDGLVEQVIALNPQLYWRRGDPVEALLDSTRERRRDEIAWIREQAATGRWDEEDALGLRPPAGVWLDELAASPTRVSLVFAGGDDGLVYLRDRLGRRLAELVQGGGIHVLEVADIDHAMQQTWRRPAMIAAFAAELDHRAESTPTSRRRRASSA